MKKFSLIQVAFCAAAMIAGEYRINAAALAPITLNLNPTGVTANSVTFRGTVDPQGQAGVTAYFQYSYASGTPLQTAPLSIPATIGPVELDITVTENHSIDVRYAFTIVAVLSTNIYWDHNRRVYVYAPTPFTDSATSITTTSAILNAVADIGVSPSVVHFDWGTSLSYGNSTASSNITTLGQTEVALPLQNLAPNTMYHYRSVISNATTTAIGRDIAFKTESPSFGTWTPLTNLAPTNVGPMVLLSDGTVLARAYDGSKNWFRLVPDTNGGYVNGSWHQDIGPMKFSRNTFCAAVLRDGRVLVPGGEHGETDNGQINNAEVYNPIGKSWNLTASVSNISDSISDANTAMLADGRVLVGIVSPKPAPGQPGYPIIYDPVSDNWTQAGGYAGGFLNENEASWLKLPDDSILCVDKFSTTSQRYIPKLDQWISDTDTPVNLWEQTETGPALLLPSGNAFFIGGGGHTAIYKPSGDTNAGTWIARADVPNAMGALDAPAAMMVNGKILCIVSRISSIYSPPTQFYEYDYLSDSFALIGAPADGTETSTNNYGSSGQILLDLPDGSVLYTVYDRQLYVYRPVGGPIAAGKPTIDSISANPDESLHLIGTLFNGISTGTAYGDEGSNDSNYPLVRFTDANGNIRYGRTYNWSSTGVMTGSALVSTECMLPAGASLQDGIEVVANGIASDIAHYPRWGAYDTWVDFNFTGIGNTGTFDNPYETMVAGVNNAPPGSVIHIKPSKSSETIRITKALRVEAYNGTANIGH